MPSSSSPLRIRAIGGESQLSQISRIRDGFIANGATLVTTDREEVDLIYANDAGTHRAALDYRAQFAPNAKVILNVLDIPEHLFPPNGKYGPQELNKLRGNLEKADAITAISPFTQAQIARLIGLPTYLVWNPVKDVSPDIRLDGKRPYPYRVLISGRTLDLNKRITNLAIPALITAGFEESEVAIIGGEYPGWGTNLGLVSDGMLNDLLNSVDYVISTTLCTGLELGPIEGMICGAVPILTYDTSTFTDVGYPKHWGCHPSVSSLAYRLYALNHNPSLFEGEQKHALSMGEHLAEFLSKKTVAQRILQVYNKIQSTNS